jgi:hypothetical protein
MEEIDLLNAFGQTLSAFADADSSCCFTWGFREGISQMAQL